MYAEDDHPDLLASGRGRGALYNRGTKYNEMNPPPADFDVSSVVSAVSLVICWEGEGEG